MVQEARRRRRRAVLTDVKAVAAGYPLRGAIVLVDAGQPRATRRTRHSRARRSVDRHAARRAPWRRRRATKLAVGDATLTVGGDRRAGARDRERTDVRAGPEAAAEPRRRAGDESAAARQSRDVAAAGRRRASRGDARTLSATWLAARTDRRAAVETVRDLRPEVRQTLERAEQLPRPVGARRGAARGGRRRARGIALPAAASRRGGDVPLLRRVGARERWRCSSSSSPCSASPRSASASSARCVGQQLLAALLASAFVETLPLPAMRARR